MYILEGNIGAGKTTFLKLLKQKVPSLAIALEPVQSWQSEVQGQSLLSHFYTDPHRWAYTMETWALACRVPEHIKDQQSGIPLVVERSIYSGHYCFALNSYLSGYMSEMEWKVYSQFFEYMTAKCLPPAGFIYMHVDPVIALERIKKRNRSGESGIPLEYLEEINTRHQEFLITKKQNTLLKDVPVLILDCSKNFEKNPEIFDAYCERVYYFIQQTNEVFDISSFPFHTI